jgi:AcrR family transcriptional regulator
MKNAESDLNTKSGANMGIKENRKTRYTKKALCESIIELMKSKAITHITIKEICCLADISRSTFYSYYNDQYDLLKRIEDETTDYIEDILKKLDKTRSMNEIINIIEDLMQYISCNNNSIQVLLSENGDINFQKRFFQRFERYMINYFAEKLEYNPEINPEIMEYYSAYVINGSIALVQHWLKNNMDLPVPKIARLLIQLSSVFAGQ